MELISALVGLFILWSVIRFVFGLLGAGARAVHSTVTGKERYFGTPQLKFVDETHEDTGWQVKKIMFRGALPNHREMDLSFVLSAFDVTGGKDSVKPVFSLAEAAQEENTICYQQRGNFGRVGEGTAITDWVQLGVVIPELLQPAYSGSREIEIAFRIFNTIDPPIIVGGLAIDDGDSIFARTLSFTHQFSDKGYEEASKDREEAQAIALKIGVAVAMADGSLDDPEGDLLKNWIVKEVSSYSDSKKKKLKKLYNGALKEGFALAAENRLSLSDLVERLGEIGDKKAKYDAVELCLDVMAADGVADAEEMKVIRNVAEALGLDAAEIEQMRQAVTLNLSAELTSQEGLESLVGIDNSWSDEQKSKHLRAEFQKWSNRLNAMSEGEERDNAQSMLDNIAELRKKYG